MNYVEIIKTALCIFPFISLFISFPFILTEYHKFGSISFRKSVIIYSFVLYMICAYFLVILPLPKISDVLSLTTPRVQLIPFSFIKDIITNFSLSSLYIPFYNLLLTIPFGIYLKYLFKCDFKKTILYSFLLTLFYELTQLSGLYFIYPRGYRLFDVDDLMLNTLGGIFGFYISKPFIKLLPTIDKINDDAKEEGKKITGFKRSTSVILDLFIYSITSLFLYVFIKTKYYFYITILIYYFIIPLFLDNCTIAEKFLNLKIVDLNNKKNTFKLYLRRIIFILIYFELPIFFIKLSKYLTENLKVFYIVFLIIFISLFYIKSFCKYFFTNKDLLYERISKTKLVSTIK